MNIAADQLGGEVGKPIHPQHRVVVVAHRQHVGDQFSSTEIGWPFAWIRKRRNLNASFAPVLRPACICPGGTYDTVPGRSGCFDLPSMSSTPLPTMDAKGFVVPPGGGPVLSMAPGRSVALKLLSGGTGE